MQSKLIIALDFDNQARALRFIESLDPNDCALKVGSEMFTLFGSTFVRLLIDQQYRVFLDLKFHDIPNTVACACIAAADLGVWMLNVHASGGLAMMQAARKALDSYGSDRPLLIAVTTLTSMSSDDLQSIGVDKDISTHINHLACLTKTAGLDGVVSSALEVPAIKALCGHSFLTITPGIRMPTDHKNDQQRIVTPKMALTAGSDYLVVGRPITCASDPVAAFAQWLHELSTADE